MKCCTDQRKMEKLEKLRQKLITGPAAVCVCVEVCLPVGLDLYGWVSVHAWDGVVVWWHGVWVYGDMGCWPKGRCNKKGARLTTRSAIMPHNG